MVEGAFVCNSFRCGLALARLHVVLGFKAEVRGARLFCLKEDQRASTTFLLSIQHSPAGCMFVAT